MTAINSNRAIRGPVTAVPVVAGKGVRIVPDVENNRFVVEADETVLWENANGEDESNGFTVSEQFTNFERIRLVGVTNDANYSIEIPAYSGITSTFRFSVSGMAKDSDGARLQVYGKSFTSSNGLTYSLYASPARWFSNSTVTSVNGLTALNGKIYKIVGINRISST
jgi:hypothetical protein